MSDVFLRVEFRIRPRAGLSLPRLLSLVVAVLFALASLTFALSGCRALFGPAGPFGRGGPEPPDPEQARLVAASSNALAFDLLEKLSVAAAGKNVVLSPLSISALLAMLLEGADGETAAAIAGVLHLPWGQDPAAGESAGGFGTLLNYISHPDATGPDVELAIGNAIWPTVGYPLTDEFVETMTDDFRAEVAELDLGSQQAADEIDHWVAEKTRGRIQRMSDALGLPDPGAVTVLMNAVYFKGNWTHRFDKEATQPGMFTFPDGTEVTVPMMCRRGEFEVAEGALADGLGFLMLRLPYGEDQRFVMEILLPGLPDIGRFVAGLTPEARLEAAAALAEQEVFLVMPSFELEYEATRELDAALQDFGMAIAYSPESDFTAMSPRDPWLSRIAHKTYIRVDEEGSEAAGVTGGVMRESMPAELRVDRPFMFIITDTDTGVILFMGVVTDPTA